ncbi:unnamed protein product [marine sediment metagenome]|uniref:Uncharacterized protein n=1 Tax=marine sediment metagenome TaxID=412755 RepID=X1N0E1_9ZZZZ
MKMFMIAYNSAIESEVMEILEKYSIESYTKWTQVQGKGKMSGTHLGTNIWPGENSVLFCAIEGEKTENLIKLIKEHRKKSGNLGIKAFVWNLEEIT